MAGYSTTRFAFAGFLGQSSGTFDLGFCRPSYDPETNSSTSAGPSLRTFPTSRLTG